MKKECVRCKETKYAREFYKAVCWSDGIDYYCIKCRLDTTAASRKKRAKNGPPCENCGERYVYYAKGLCHACYCYKLRTGKDRKTENDYARYLIDWAFRAIKGEPIEDIAACSGFHEETVHRALYGTVESKNWVRAYDLLPDELKKEVRYSLSSRLRPRDVRKIRELARLGYTQTDIGRYNRTYSAISRIVNGSRYPNVV